MFLLTIFFFKVPIKLRIVGRIIFNHNNIFCVCSFHMVIFLLSWVYLFLISTFCEPWARSSSVPLSFGVRIHVYKLKGNFIILILIWRTIIMTAKGFLFSPIGRSFRILILVFILISIFIRLAVILHHSIIGLSMRSFMMLPNCGWIHSF